MLISQISHLSLKLFRLHSELQESAIYPTVKESNSTINWPAWNLIIILQVREHVYAKKYQPQRNTNFDTLHYIIGI